MLSKWVMYAALLLAYSLGVVHVTKTYTDSSWNSKELKRTEDFLKTTQENEALRKDISKLLQENLAQTRANSKQFTKELLDEITKDPRYKSCRTTDSVRDALQRKLDSQPK